MTISFTSTFTAMKEEEDGGDSGRQHDSRLNKCSTVVGTESSPVGVLAVASSDQCIRVRYTIHTANGH